MAVDKKDVAKILEEIGLLLQIKGENPFKVRAYERGARAVEMLNEDLDTLVKEKRLNQIDGIGKALEQKIEELVTTGRLRYYEDLKKEFPETLFELLKIPGLGPKRVHILYNELGISTLGELEYACMENRLLNLPGFGKKVQENILKGLEYLKRYRDRFLLPDALMLGDSILDRIKEHPRVVQANLAGSLRRKRELIKDIDILVSSLQPEEVMDYFVKIPEVKDVVGKGETKSSVRLENGMAADLRVVQPEQYPYALHHFTGSKEHNTAMRHYAKGIGLKMNEYGLFEEHTQKIIPCRSEEEVFQALGMQYIVPELREDMGEIQSALEHRLPNVVQKEDIKGIFHVHSHYSDGISGIAELAAEAKALGYGYIGISDHSQSAFYAQGLKKDDILRQHQEIDRLNSALDGFRILKGIEVDILPDGSLDYPDDLLATFDFVIAAVHSRFSMNKDEMTRRIIDALDNPYVTVLAHPTGRLLLSRQEYPLNMEKILEKAAEKGVYMEINANPHRLDLDWRLCKIGKDLGVKFVIGTDAHDLDSLRFSVYGVWMAQKGWLEKGDILNCLDYHELEGMLRAARRQQN
jgi:DNA polymerase (family 10)